MMANPPSRSVPVVLLVEDDEDHIEFTRLALADGDIRVELHVVHDGEEAFAFLERKPPHGSAPRPDLILLDLNLPRMDGSALLQRIRATEELRAIPVVIMTTSRAQEDVLNAYGMYANCFVRKPADFNRYVEVVKAIDRFWLDIVTLPGRE